METEFQVTWNTKDQLIIDFLSVDPFSPVPNDKWSKLFNYYNSQLKVGEKGLGMSCRPCYAKVYEFLRQKLINECLAAIH